VTAAVTASLYLPPLKCKGQNEEGARNVVVQTSASPAFYPETQWMLGKISSGRRCSANQSNHNVQHRNRANCPNQSSFMHKIATEYSQWRNGQSPITLVAVGCNKGDSIVEAMRMFSFNSEISTVKWYNKLKDELGEKARGACQKAYVRDSAIPKEMTPRPVRAYCIEPAKSTFEVISRISKDLEYSQFGLSIIHGACAERETVLSFPVVDPGKENMRLVAGQSDQTKYDLVNVTTIDHLTERENLSVIDFLSVDTEGHDFPVLLGAVLTLATKTVRVIEFEYHVVGRWKAARIEELLDYLDNLGFDCYWENNQGALLRMTGCYSEQMTVPEFKSWSNAICVNRREESLAQFMESLASQAGFGADL